jgi:type IV pilus assembly protein PilB
MKIYNPGFIKALAQRDILSWEKVTWLRSAREPGVNEQVGVAASGGGLREGQASGARVDDARILNYLLSKSLLDPREAGEMWANGFGLPWVNLRHTLFQAHVVARLPRQFAVEHSVIPIYQMGERITAAFADPSDTAVLLRSEELVRCQISPVCAFREDIQDAIKIQYSSFDSLQELTRTVDLVNPVVPDDATGSPGAQEKLADEKLADEKLADEKLVDEKPADEKPADEEAAGELLRTLLLLTIKEGASDLHIEPFHDHVLIRFRVDGVLDERMRLTHDVYKKLVARVKMLCRMDRCEQRRPQDGAMSIDVYRSTVDFRVSTLPMVDGEKVLIRVSKQLEEQGVPKLMELDMAAPVYAAMTRAMGRSNGILIVTGPTGSGKTTTLYSALESLDRARLNVITIEDPVEYRLPLTNQLQVNAAVGLDFAPALRSILRQDPDVVLIGDLRDPETARIATQAALTGHLVLTTMHTNDAVHAVTRLVEMGVEPYMAGPAINAIVAQRLVRRICDGCREAYTLEAFEAARYFKHDGRPVSFYRGRGCPSCNNTGYKGRLAIHELLEISEALRELIVCRASIAEIRRAAEHTGYASLRYDGMKKVLRGLTTIDEINRVVMATD